MTDSEPNSPRIPAKPWNPSRCRRLLARDESQLVVIDVQDKFVPHLPAPELLIEQCGLLIQGAKLLGIPVSVSEQNPDKLGRTVSPLREMLPAPATKLRFSSVECLFGNEQEPDTGRRQIVICGIETHVCVLQTASDLLAWGWDVYVVADAVQSRYPTDREFALRRLEAGGVILTTAESVLFEWCETAAAAEFRDISRLVKSRSPRAAL